jgi:hypothetical protein
MKRITSGNVVFYAALSTQVLVLLIYILSKTKLLGLGFLWLNPIGAFGVVFFTILYNRVVKGLYR